MDQPQVDAWMFLAVAVGRGQGSHAGVKDVVAAADWVNHAIPLEEELTRGLNRLMAGGYVSNSGDTFALTHAGEALYLRVQQRAGIWTQLDRLKAAFESLQSPVTPLWTPTSRTVQAGIDTWLREADAIIRTIDCRRRRRPKKA